MGWPTSPRPGLAAMGLCGLLLGRAVVPPSPQGESQSLVWRAAKSAAARVVQPAAAEDLAASARPAARAPTLADVAVLSARQIAHLAVNVGARAAELGEKCVEHNLASAEWRAGVARRARAAAEAALAALRQHQDAVSQHLRVETGARDGRLLHAEEQATTPAVMVPAVRQLHALRAAIREQRRCPTTTRRPDVPALAPAALHEDFYKLNAFSE